LDNAAVFTELQKLNREELFAKAYHTKYHADLNLKQYLYLSTHRTTCINPDDLFSPESIAEQDRLLTKFRRTMHQQSITAQYSMSPDCDLEMEQMLRYIHFPAHRHDFLEFVCVLNGNCMHTIDSQQFVHPTGDLAIVPPNILHEHSISPDGVCFTIKVRAERFVSLFRDLIEENNPFSAYFTQMAIMPGYCCAITLRGGEDDFIRNLLLTIYKQQKEEHLYSQRIVEKLWEVLFAYYLQNYQDTVHFLEAKTFREFTTSEVINYMFSNFQTITLQETARHFHFTPAYLSTKIHKTTGKTFSQLLIEYRLYRAANLLTSTTFKLDHICEEIGYQNSSQFTRLFRKYYGVSPMAYRRSQKAM